MRDFNKMSERNGAFTEQTMTIVPSIEMNKIPTKTSDGKWVIGYDNWEPIIIDKLDDQMASVVEGSAIENQVTTNGGDCLLKKSEETQTFSQLFNDDEYFSLDYVDREKSLIDEKLPSEQPSTVSTCENSSNTSGVPTVALPIEWPTEDDSFKKEGVVGLTNLGNTCFINSGLQCLFNNWRLVHYFSEYDSSKIMSEKNETSLAKSFISLLQNVWSKERKDKVIKNNDFKDALGQRFVQFKDYRQHDCQEFLALLLSSLHDELKEDQHDQQNNESEEIQSIEEEKSTISSPSSVSSCSSDVHLKDEDEIRKQPIPDTIKSFKIPPALAKETKISNTNVLKEDDERNNQINFNSVKYPMIRKKDQFVDNLGAGDFFIMNNDENEIPPLKGCKRIKQTNLTNENQLKHHNNNGALRSMNQSLSSKNSNLSPSCSNNSEDMFKSMINSSYKSSCSNAISSSPSSSISCKRQKINAVEQDDGSSEWRQYLGYNKTSIIVDSFQGQFKSTIKCFNCDHISVTYEPFMYLALPLPHALERQIVVTVVNSLDYSYCCRDVKDGKPIKYLLDLHKYDKVSKLVEKLNEQMNQSEQQQQQQTFNMCVAEVQDNYIVKLFDNDTCLRNVDDKDKNVYAFIVSKSFNSQPPLPPPPPSSLQITSSASSSSTQTISASLPLSKSNNSYQTTSTSTSTSECSNNNLMWPMVDLSSVFDAPSNIVCNICLEEKSPGDILLHDVSCNCSLCPPCLDNMISHYCKDSDNFLCPICTISLTKDNFYPIESEVKVNNVKPRNLQLPLLFRVDQQNGSNQRFKLLSYPLVIEVMNVINGAKLYEIVNRLVPYPCPYSLHFVDQQGQRCSRCFWSSDCSGCEISRYSDVTINCGDTIAVEFESLDFSICDLLQESFLEHCSMNSFNLNKSSSSSFLSLHDCLTEFSQSEILDDDNPWFCPVCLSNQRANKSLSIWRSPDTLMVYLKRFIFHEMQSIKIDDPIKFPIDKLDMSSFIKGPNNNNHIYSLQSFVCHSGGVNSGHYTSFAKHSTTNEWLYFNDETVTNQDPSDKDERAYILFYQRPKTETIVPPKVNNMIKSTASGAGMNNLKNGKVLNGERILEDRCNNLIDSENMIIA